MPFPFNILMFLLPALAAIDAIVRLFSPRKYRAFLAWVNRSKCYSEDIKNTHPSDRQLRIVGAIMLLFLVAFFWNATQPYWGNGNSRAVSTSPLQEAQRPIPWLSLLFGLALIVSGLVTFRKPRILHRLLTGPMNVKFPLLPEHEVLRGLRLVAGFIAVAGFILVLAIIFKFH